MTSRPPDSWIVEHDGEVICTNARFVPLGNHRGEPICYGKRPCGQCPTCRVANLQLSAHG